jgi:hypothetical protein
LGCWTDCCKAVTDSTVLTTNTPLTAATMQHPILASDPALCPVQNLEMLPHSPMLGPRGPGIPSGPFSSIIATPPGAGMAPSWLRMPTPSGP